MSFINPLAGSLAQSGQVQRLQSADKDREMQRAEALRRSSDAERDRMEHEVDTFDAVTLQSEDDQHQEEGRRQKRKRRGHNSSTEDDKTPGGLDLTA